MQDDKLTENWGEFINKLTEAPADWFDALDAEDMPTEAGQWDDLANDPIVRECAQRLMDKALAGVPNGAGREEAYQTIYGFIEALGPNLEAACNVVANSMMREHFDGRDHGNNNAGSDGRPEDDSYRGPDGPDGPYIIGPTSR